MTFSNCPPAFIPPAYIPKQEKPANDTGEPETPYARHAHLVRVAAETVERFAAQLHAEADHYEDLSRRMGEDIATYQKRLHKTPMDDIWT